MQANCILYSHHMYSIHILTSHMYLLCICIHVEQGARVLNEKPIIYYNKWHVFLKALPYICICLYSSRWHIFCIYIVYYMYLNFIYIHFKYTRSFSPYIIKVIFWRHYSRWYASPANSSMLNLEWAIVHKLDKFIVLLNF